MARGKPIPIEDRHVIVKLHSRGYKVCKIAQIVKRKWCSVQSVLRHWKKTGTVHPKPRTGRPKKTTPRIERKISQLAQRNRKLTLTQMQITLQKELNVEISTATLRRRLHSMGFEGKVAKKKPFLSERHISKRLQWCKEKESWTLADWKKVLWSDESKFCLFGRSGSQYVWRRTGESLAPGCVSSTVKHGGGKYIFKLPPYQK